jgi:hypothetical protein
LSTTLSTTLTGFSASSVQARIDHLELAAELARDERRFAFEGDQRITQLALREGRRRRTSATVEHRHVGEDARDQRLRCCRADAVLDRRDPTPAR